MSKHNRHTCGHDQLHESGFNLWRGIYYTGTLTDRYGVSYRGHKEQFATLADAVQYRDMLEGKQEAAA